MALRMGTCLGDSGLQQQTQNMMEHQNPSRHAQELKDSDLSPERATENQLTVWEGLAGQLETLTSARARLLFACFLLSLKTEPHII